MGRNGRETSVSIVGFEIFPCPKPFIKHLLQVIVHHTVARSLALAARTTAVKIQFAEINLFNFSMIRKLSKGFIQHTCRVTLFAWAAIDC